MTIANPVVPFTLAAGEGERLSWLGDPTVLKAISEHTQGRYAVAEIVSSPVSVVPMHVHHREDEAFYVLEGSVSFWLGPERIDLGPGGFAFGPRDVPHRYEVTSELARMLMVFSPGGFEGFIRETSHAVGDASAVPEPPEDLDLGLMLAAAERYGAEVLG